MRGLRQRLLFRNIIRVQGEQLQGKTFYVAGYGRVGKMVADVLTSLGGK